MVVFTEVSVSSYLPPTGARRAAAHLSLSIFVLGSGEIPELSLLSLCTWSMGFSLWTGTGSALFPWGPGAACSHAPGPRHDDRLSLELVLWSLGPLFSAWTMAPGGRARGPVQTVTP